MNHTTTKGDDVQAKKPMTKINDEKNERYLFQGTDTDLLVGIVNGMIDPVELARFTLHDRGLDTNGKWIDRE